MWTLWTIQWFYHFKAKCPFWISLLWIVYRPFPAIVLQRALSSIASYIVNTPACPEHLSVQPQSWLRAALFSFFTRARKNHYKLTWTERITWQTSDVWTLLTKAVMYRDKYHLMVGIHTEKSDCLQLTWVHAVYNSPKLVSATDAAAPICKTRTEQAQKSLSHMCVKEMRTHHLLCQW